MSPDGFYKGRLVKDLKKKKLSESLTIISCELLIFIPGQFHSECPQYFGQFCRINEAVEAGQEYYKENLKSIIFTEDPRLSDTYYTQPILMLRVLHYLKFEKTWVSNAKISAGHSLEKFQHCFVRWD